MFFWSFMLVMDLLFPVIMVLFGAIFSRVAPKRINYIFGYRTERSMKNEDTWVFAHKFIGRLWLFIGIPMLIVSASVMLLLLGASETVVSAVGTGLCFLQLAGVIIPVFPTERALKRTFDKNGNRKG